MASRYNIGQKVIIKQVNSSTASLRDCTIEPYAGQVGEIANYSWLVPPGGEVFYLYTVRVDHSYKEIVLYEDEITSFKK